MRDMNVNLVNAKNEIAKRYGYDSWDDLKGVSPNLANNLIDIVAVAYADKEAEHSIKVGRVLFNLPNYEDIERQTKAEMECFGLWDKDMTEEDFKLYMEKSFADGANWVKKLVEDAVNKRKVTEEKNV